MTETKDKVQKLEDIFGDVEQQDSTDTALQQNAEDTMVTSYEKPDSDDGYTDDSVEITQLQATHLTDVVFNQMLGDYNDDGEYLLEPSIIEELANMPKHVVRKDKNGTYVDAKYEDKVFHFCITPYIKKENGDAYCYLQLLEPVEYANGYVIDTKTTVVATYEYRLQDGYEDYVFAAFNVDQDDNSGDEGGRRYVDADHIKRRIAYLDALALVSVDLYEKLEEAYFNRRIQILNSLPEGTLVLAEFNKERSKIEKYFVGNSTRKYKALNDLLTSVIDGPSGEHLKSNKQYRELMGEANTKYLNTVKQIDESAKHSSEVQKALDENDIMENAVKKVATSNLKPNVKPGDTHKPPKKSGSKSKKPYVPSPDKRTIPKSKGGGGKKVEDGGAELDIQEETAQAEPLDLKPENIVNYDNNRPRPTPPPSAGQPSMSDIFGNTQTTGTESTNTDSPAPAPMPR